MLKRLDLARRYRNDDLYGETAPPSAGQRDEAIADAETLVAELERRLKTIPSNDAATTQATEIGPGIPLPSNTKRQMDRE